MIAFNIAAQPHFQVIEGNSRGIDLRELRSIGREIHLAGLPGPRIVESMTANVNDKHVVGLRFRCEVGKSNSDLVLRGLFVQQQADVLRSKSSASLKTPCHLAGIGRSKRQG